MKVKVIRKFKDKHTGKTHRRGEVMEITKERFQEISKVGEFVQTITENAQSDASAASETDTVNVSNDEMETAETPAYASSDATGDTTSDGFDEMSIRELKEYADKAYKLAFKNGAKKAEIIEVLRRREQHG